MSENENRPNPDDMLLAISREQLKDTGGKLRVFLGMSAGVGKTYAMLKAAHQKLKEGVDVVVAVVETHGRPETLALLDGLDILPRRQITYRNTQMEEMDLDAVLERNPKIVVVDELAHTNVHGSRHEKRYQDVLELLDAGIDVYTALNVQHLESRKDSVEAITGIPIRETVPDSILERASLVELVDIAPTELLKRLREGKVYLGEKAAHAENNFFKEDKLTALREIALRMTAERVDQDLQRFISVRQNQSPWQTNERLLVAISHSPYSERLIRATRRLAYNLEAPWIAVHVDTGVKLNDEDQAQLVKNLNLARELKAEVITTTEVEASAAIRRISRQRNVTQVIVGRPSRRWLRDIFYGGSLLDRLVRESAEVDIHVIRQDKVSEYRPAWWREIYKYRTGSPPIQYWFVFCFIASIVFFSSFIDHLIGYHAVGFIFLLAVLVTGIFASLGPVIFGSVLTALSWNFFFIPPKMTFAISSLDDFLMCVAFLLVSAITGFLTNRIRFHEKLMREREERTNVLYEILQLISNSENKSEFLAKVTVRVGEILKADCGVILKSAAGGLRFDEVNPYSVPLNEKDQAVARWCYENEKSAGWSTDTLAQARSLFIPLKGQSETVGIFVFQPQKKFRKLDLEQENLLFSIARQLGTAIERHLLTQKIVESQRLEDSENLHQTLLNSISHEMRTPLTAILSAASTLENGELQNKEVREIGKNLLDAGERLNRVIENLLDMSRLNSGILALNLEWHDFNDLLSVTAKKLEKSLLGHHLEIQFADEVPLLRIDFRLMEHALSNLILNAALYSPAGTKIEIKLRRQNDKFSILIEDEGPGIPKESIASIFDKFYRVPGSPPGGTGLGLSIVKSIVELHRGHIEVENIEPHGARFRIELPMEAKPEFPTEFVP